MLEPRAARQTVRVGQSAFALEQLEIHLRQGGSSQRGPALLSRLCIHPLIVIGALVESIQRVLQGSKIQVRRHGFGSGRHQRLPGVGRRAEYAFADLAVALADLIALVFGQALQVVYVTTHGGE